MTEIEPCPRYGAGLLNDFGGGDVNWWQDYLRAELERAHDFYEAAWPAPTAPSGDVERAVMVCPQCEGEGGYPDGMDEAACHTECTRCGSNGWIVNQAAIAAMRPARGVELAETGAVIRLTPRLLLDRMLPSGAGLDDAPDSKIVAMYLSLGELRGLRGLIAALRQAGEG